MTVTKIFVDAQRTLDLAPDADGRALKRAYRRAIRAHPPDRDPEGFRRIRDAYEILRDPHARAKSLLMDPRPAVPPPAIGEPAEPGASALVVLRSMAATISAKELLGVEDE